MKKPILTLLAGVAVFVVIAIIILRPFNTQEIHPCSPATSNPYTVFSDSLSQDLNWPDILDITVFAGPDLTPSPASLGGWSNR